MVDVPCLREHLKDMCLYVLKNLYVRFEYIDSKAQCIFNLIKFLNKEKHIK